MDIIDFKDKKWLVKARIHESKVTDHTKLKKLYSADLVLKSNGYYFVVEAIIDAEFEEIKDNKKDKK